VPRAIHISESVLVPSEALEVRAVRSSGPGGQNVNKVASKVEMHVDLSKVRGLGPSQRSRLEVIVGGRRDASGRLLVTSQRTRDFPTNLEDAREKVRRMVDLCLIPPKRRHATKPSAAARSTRLAEKRLMGQRKRTRGRVASEE
jgi:ribosome-associated protein